jgi:hypothetical protein
MPASEVVTASFVRKQRLGSIKLSSPYSAQYTGGGDGALLDGIRGRQDFRLGGWQGYEGTDLDAVVDLDSARIVSAVSLGCLQDNNSWIFLPASVEFSFSDDGVNWHDAVRVDPGVSPKETSVVLKDVTATVPALRARYVRVRAANIGVCPPWHRGAGGKAWLFADEITVR